MLETKSLDSHGCRWDHTHPGNRLMGLLTPCPLADGENFEASLMRLSHRTWKDSQSFHFVCTCACVPVCCACVPVCVHVCVWVWAAERGVPSTIPWHHSLVLGASAVCTVCCLHSGTSQFQGQMMTEVKFEMLRRCSHVPVLCPDSPLLLPANGRG